MTGAPARATTVSAVALVAACGGSSAPAAGRPATSQAVTQPAANLADYRAGVASVIAKEKSAGTC